jgi:hypothetical protein
MRNAVRVATLQSLQEFFKTVLDRERAVRDAKTLEEREYSFNEYMDCLELYAGAYNARLLRKLTREIVRDKIIDVVVVLELLPESRAQVEKAINSPAVYSHLYAFVKSHRTTITSRLEARKADLLPG